jgi:hypothetical protein
VSPEIVPTQGITGLSEQAFVALSQSLTKARALRVEFVGNRTRLMLVNNFTKMLRVDFSPDKLTPHF